jgi:hypothetical protein
MPASRTSRQRRRHPRIEVDGTVTAQDLTTGSVVVIRDISAGGFRTESRRAAVVGRTHIFRVRLPNRDTCVLQAAAVHCQATTGARQTTLIGWRAESDPTTVDALHRLIEAVTTLDPGVVGGTGTAADADAAFTTAGSKAPVRSLRWPRE